MQSTSVPLSRRLSNTEISVLWWLFHRRQNCWLTDMTTCSGGSWCAPRPLVFHTFSRTGGGAPGSDVVGGGSDDDDDDDDDGDTDNDIGTGAPRRGVTTICPKRETRYAGYCCTAVDLCVRCAVLLDPRHRDEWKNSTTAPIAMYTQRFSVGRSRSLFTNSKEYYQKI